MPLLKHVAFSTAFAAALSITLLIFTNEPASAQTKWQQVSVVGPLPPPDASGYVARTDARIWYADYNPHYGPTLLLLHGGGGSSDHWSRVIRHQRLNQRVIVMDSRGHGRSTNDAAAISYEQMAEDTIAVLDHLGVKTATVVGWSDGANIGFYLALRYPERTARLVAFAGNATPAGYQRNTNPSTMAAYVARSKREYETLSPAPERYAAVMGALSVMWKTQPTLTAKDFAKIKSPTAIFHAEYDEVIRRAHSQEIASQIPGAQFVLLPGVSHFATFQDPDAFSAAIEKFIGQ